MIATVLSPGDRSTGARNTPSAPVCPRATAMSSPRIVTVTPGAASAVTISVTQTSTSPGDCLTVRLSEATASGNW